MRGTLGVLLFVGAASACLFPDLEGLTGTDAATHDDAAIDADADAATQDDAAIDVGIDAPPCPALGRVQFAHAVGDGGVGTTESVSLPLAQNGGDFIVVGVNYDPTCGPVQAVTDTSGDTYVGIIPPDEASGALALETWGAMNIAPTDAGTNVVTVAFPNACSLHNVKVVEYAGINRTAPIDDSTSLHGVDAAVDGSLTTTHSGLLFAHTADEHTADGPGPGWTEIFIDDWGTLAQDEQASLPGLYVVTYQPSEENWVIQAVALRSCQGM